MNDQPSLNAPADVYGRACCVVSGMTGVDSGDEWVSIGDGYCVNVWLNEAGERYAAVYREGPSGVDTSRWMPVDIPAKKYLPEAAQQDKQGGWTIDPKFLQRVVDEIDDDIPVYSEEVEAVVLWLKRNGYVEIEMFDYDPSWSAK